MNAPMPTTADQLRRLLATADLRRMRQWRAETFGIAETTLARRLRAEGTSYQSLLDAERLRRCRARLSARRLPGKCLADELGFRELNSFYRAFRRWTGQGYRQYRRGL